MQDKKPLKDSKEKVTQNIWLWLRHSIMSELKNTKIRNIGVDIFGLRPYNNKIIRQKRRQDYGR